MVSKKGKGKLLHGFRLNIVVTFDGHPNVVWCLFKATAHTNKINDNVLKTDDNGNDYDDDDDDSNGSCFSLTWGCCGENNDKYDNNFSRFQNKYYYYFVFKL